MDSTLPLICAELDNEKPLDLWNIPPEHPPTPPPHPVT